MPPKIRWCSSRSAMKSSSQSKPHSTGRTTRLLSRMVRAVSHEYIHFAYSPMVPVYQRARATQAPPKRLLDHHPWHTQVDAAKHFIGNRADQVGDVVGRDRVLALRTDQHNLVANPDAGNAGDIDDGLVHRHPARNGRTLAAEQHAAIVREQATEPVRIAQRQQGEPRGPHRAEGRVVASAFAGLKVAQRGDPRLPAEYGLEALV